VIELHSCVTVESLLMLPRLYQLQTLSGTLYCVAVDRTDVSENIAYISRMLQSDRTPQLCYRVVTVD
jgi:hypothetical protein